MSAWRDEGALSHRRGLHRSPDGPPSHARAERSLDLFRVPESRRAECLRELHAAAQATLSSAGGEVALPIDREEDIFRARAAVKDACARIGFGNTAQTKVVTALSELARNIVQYAGMGRITIRTLVLPRPGVEVVASDDGPGIADLTQILNPSFRSRTGMGVGLRGARSLMDFFEVQSAPGLGTTVTLRKFVGPKP
jgi:serine/threonine-protein kinase RsbT